MSTRQRLLDRVATWSAITCASALLVSGSAIVSSSGTIAKERSISELFDPTAMALSVCGPESRKAGYVNPNIELAMSTAIAATAEDPGPELWDDLGEYSFAITTDVPEAQAYFDQGLRLTYAFNHAEAVRAFRKAQLLDPDCAMCFWGEAFALGANINAPMMDAALDPALVSLDEAKDRAENTSPREQAMIEALGTRYSAESDADGVELAIAYAAAMTDVRENFPDDQDIAVFYADAVMNTSPWDYWEVDGRTAKGDLADAIAAVEGVLAGNPDHPGAIHLYIHLMEASSMPEKAEPYADRLGALMPAAGHLVHMPSHIYIRVGRHLDSIEANRAAVEADEAYFARVDDQGVYRAGYYPHNIHFVIQGAQYAGDAENVRWSVEKLKGNVSEDVAAEVGWIQAILTAPYFAHAQFSTPEDMLAVEDPGDRFPMVKAMWHYMRGVAQATKGELEQARSEAAMIAELNSANDFQFLLDWGVPAPDLLRIARHVLEGRIAQQENDVERAVQEFKVAVDIQDTLPYMEPPYWYYPVRQSLGAALTAAGRTDEAIQVYRQSLVNYPNNGWALYGLAEAYAESGDELGADETRKLYEKAWAENGMALDLSKL
ncbi:MAG: tetratricopeptide repeat protein [Geminicoccaceae bacterium]